MAPKALLLGLLVSLAAALLPPCQPGLDPEFCPSSVSLIMQDSGYTHDESIVYPELKHQDTLEEAFQQLDKSAMESLLRSLTNTRFCPNRYCMAKCGALAMEILGSHLSDLDYQGIPLSLHMVDNDSKQQSIVLRILGSGPDGGWSGDVVALGAHFDSINVRQRHSDMDIEKMVAPGADDNGTGLVVLLEVIEMLIPLFSKQRPVNQIQFQFFAAEEIGLHGSKTVFAELHDDGDRPVKAMLNLDMVGYSGGHEPGSPKIALMQDFVDKNLTDFVQNLVETYSNAEPGYTSCGYACSDHASAHAYGFPSAMIGESSYIKGKPGDKPNSYPFIHSENDTIDHIDFDYMAEFAKVAAAFVVELGYHNFTAV